ncbi:hypothetical protein FNW02_32695 [Komarekiella sp. 'clone 1']|uniref:Uncharacterized protein n=1 Tax=Komarekiella delphini-convector SJRDD-AB1 TaxID=2593771 RepID=A0AA40VUQ5_9NOST|nr:hypothetical protein [Komarekiella delphini-convector]MBD6620415.1 hypothetical protein [Komarekiella delphini-convector SJRDD-AB1]
MTTIQKQATTSCYERLEPSQPIEKPDSSSKVNKWNKRWVLSNILDRKQEHFILDDMKLLLVKSTDNQFQATLSYYITSKGWRTETSQMPGIRIVLKDSRGIGFANWSIDNLQVGCGDNHQYREHQTNFNLYAFENIFKVERDINNGSVYNC